MLDFPVKEGKIVYEYEGNTLGQRTLYFKDFGKRIALYTDLSRNSTFYSITTTTRENVVEFLKDNIHYHFDLVSKKGLTIKAPIYLINKYLRIDIEKQSLQEALTDLGAVFVKNDSISDHECKQWTYGNKEIWLDKNALILKLTSTGLNKDFKMSVSSIDFESPIDDKLFNFPADIPILSK